LGTAAMYTTTKTRHRSYFDAKEVATKDPIPSRIAAKREDCIARTLTAVQSAMEISNAQRR
jgi:hypothetical protein